MSLLAIFRGAGYSIHTFDFDFFMGLPVPYSTEYSGDNLIATPPSMNSAEDLYRHDTHE
jgi:hypothetical protein